MREEPDRAVLEKAVRDAFPNDAERILKEAYWSFDGCWLFKLCGMTIGCEPDGYIHS